MPACNRIADANRDENADETDQLPHGCVLRACVVDILAFRKA